MSKKKNNYRLLDNKVIPDCCSSCIYSDSTMRLGYKCLNYSIYKKSISTSEFGICNEYQRRQKYKST